MFPAPYKLKREGLIVRLSDYIAIGLLGMLGALSLIIMIAA